MKNLIIIILFSAGISAQALFAQNTAGKADDEERIAIAPVLGELSDEVPQSASNLLINKMTQIAAKNGLSADADNALFYMYPGVDVLSKEITPTNPPMTAVVLQVSFYIKDEIKGNIYQQVSMEVKGVGKNETKAFVSAIKNINVSDPQLKRFVTTGKTKILEFFNVECDLLMSKAQSLMAQGEKEKALRYLNSVPPVCRECYDACMEAAAHFEENPDMKLDDPGFEEENESDIEENEE